MPENSTTTCIKCENKLTEEDICCALRNEAGEYYAAICLECHKAWHEKEDSKD